MITDEQRVRNTKARLHKGTQATKAHKRALRQALLPQLEDMVVALQGHGLTKQEACEAVRWATYTIEGHN